jgi:flagellar protein FlaG
MDTKVTAFAGVPDATFSQPKPAGRPSAAAAAPVKAATGPDLRLVIEEDAGSGSYVYKTVDRLTGEVVQSLPRAELLRMRVEAKYQAGKLIRTKA